LHYLSLEINDPALRPAATWLSKSTHGLLFFGCPHQTTLDLRDSFLDRLNRLYRLTTPTAHKQKLSGSASLPLAQTITSVNKNFDRYWTRYRICFIHAELPSYALQRSDSVFSERSSAPDIPGTKRLGVVAEHCEMTQFATRNESYLAVVAVLREYAQNAFTVVSARWEKPISPRTTLLMTDLHGRPGITGNSPIRHISSFSLIIAKTQKAYPRKPFTLDVHLATWRRSFSVCHPRLRPNVRDRKRFLRTRSRVLKSLETPWSLACT